MKRKLVVFILLIIITSLGLVLRIYKLGEIPTGLNVDEVSIGYNAFSILKTGNDEYGVRLPLTFKSLGDYKPPLYIYLTSLSVGIFGLTEFAVRFPSFLFGTLLIPLLYLLFKELTKNERIALFGSFLAAVSPWSLWYSRVASEAIVALFLITLGTYLFLKSKGKLFALLASSFLFSLSVYTYHAEKLFVPLFILFVCFRDKKEIEKKNLIIFLISFVVLSLPSCFEMLFGLGAARAKMTSIINDTDFQRNIYLHNINTRNLIYNLLSNKNLLLFFHWIRKYLAYLSPSFLFYQGLNLTEVGWGLGVLNIFEIPIFLSGIYVFFKEKKPYFYTLLAWILLGVFPASVTMNEQHTIRTIIVLPPLVFISSLGFDFLANKIKKIKTRLLKPAIEVFFSIFVVWSLLYSFLIFRVHNDYGRGENFMKGTKETVVYALQNQDKYSEIIFDVRRGIKAPSLINVPHLYILFYSRYDPKKYQDIPKIDREGVFAFDKYVIRNVNWSGDKNKKNTLIIASPWNIPLGELDNAQILKKVYIGHNDLALIVVENK